MDQGPAGQGGQSGGAAAEGGLKVVDIGRERCAQQDAAFVDSAHADSDGDGEGNLLVQVVLERADFGVIGLGHALGPRAG